MLYASAAFISESSSAFSCQTGEHMFLVTQLCRYLMKEVALCGGRLWFLRWLDNLMWDGTSPCCRRCCCCLFFFTKIWYSCQSADCYGSPDCNTPVVLLDSTHKHTQTLSELPDLLIPRWVMMALLTTYPWPFVTTRCSSLLFVALCLFQLNELTQAQREKAPCIKVSLLCEVLLAQAHFFVF